MYMVLPIKVLLETDYTTACLPIFYDDKLLTENNLQIKEIREYQNFSLQFISNNTHDKFVVEDLADFQFENQNTIGNDSVFTASEKSIDIFSYKKQPVPLPPGYYSIKILHDSHYYFTYFKIIPKDLSIPEWEKMRSEVEKMVSGLANDFVSKHKYDEGSRESNSSNYYLNSKVEYFLTISNQTRMVIEKLRSEAKYKVSIKYKWENIGKVKTIDIQSIRKMAERPDKTDYIYSPNHYLEYDVPENRWMKYIIHYFSKFCRTSVKYYKSIKTELTKNYQREKIYFSKREYSSIDRSSNDFTINRYESSLKEVDKKISQLALLHSYFEEVLNDDLLKNVNSKRTKFIPKSLVLSPKYNILYRIFSKLNRKQGYTLDHNYNFYWKQTAKLYEIWGYIKIISLLKKGNYVPISGWIFDQVKSSDILPFLDDGTCVVMKNDSLLLKVIYNEEIPYGSSPVASSIPVTTSSNRRKPDIRIDIYASECNFIGTIIVDTKYMKLRTIVKDHNHSKIVEQLSSYKNDINSKSLAIPENFKTSFSCVQAVFGMYSGDDNGKVPDYISDMGIYYYRVTPRDGSQKFLKKLLSELEVRKKNYKIIIGSNKD